MRYALICLGLIACGDKDPGDDSSTTASFTDADGDGVAVGTDCDDDNAAVFPGAVEICDGFDNDCNGTVDDDPSDGTVGWVDADGDGFGDADTRVVTCDASGLVSKAGDCNDEDAAIHPDAAEVCDREDNDCDGYEDDEDDDVEGLETFYLDADADGYGTSDTTVEACSAPDGYVENDDDCEDGSFSQSPDQQEVTCDGIDNDCDGVLDANVVPRDYATLQEAIDDVADFSEICIGSGSYTDPLDLTGRTLTLKGRTTAANVRFEIGENAPLVTVDNYDDLAGEVGDAPGVITFENLTVADATLEAVVGEPVEGGFLYLRGASAVFKDVIIENIDLSLSDGSVWGGVVYARSASVQLLETSVDGLSVTYNDSLLGRALNLGGGVVYATDSSVVLRNVDIDGTSVTTVDDPRTVYTWGTLAHVEGGSSLSASGVSVTGSTIDTTASQTNELWGLGLSVVDSDADLTDVSFTDNTVTLASGAHARSYGVLWAGDTTGGHSLTIDGLTASDNSLTTTSSGANSLSHGVVSLHDLSADISHATFYDNTVRADITESSTSGLGYGALHLVGVDGTVSHLDSRGNTVYGEAFAYGGGAFIDQAGASSTTVSNFLFAGNAVSSGVNDAFGGGLHASSGDGTTLMLVNGDFVANVADGGDEGKGGALSLSNGDGTASVVNVNVVENSATGTTGAVGQAVRVFNSDNLTRWAYNNLYDQDTEPFAGMDDPTGTEGNISENPGYVAYSGSSATGWDLRTRVSSDVRDAGDPAILDADGSASDIGAYGGPGGASW